MRISDWSSDVCSSDLLIERRGARRRSFKVWSKTMLKKIFSGIAIAAMMATTAAPTAALAHDRGKHHWHKKHDRGHYRDRGYDRDRGYYRDAGYYRGDRRYYGYRCKRDNGTGGLVIGAIAGGLMGNEIEIGRAACRERGCQYV